MLDALRQAVTASKAVHFNDPQCAQLTFKEAFYLATLGGARCVGLASRLGNFLPGKFFDALLIDPQVDGSPFDVFPDHDSRCDIFEKFLFLGDDRNIVKVRPLATLANSISPAWQVFVGGTPIYPFDSSL